MATTTNFGWETPDDTDLVKDGALAMRTLGNSIDTSFVDLKGGTTGQVLSKTSNTDLDFTWVTSDDANAIQNAIVDAKGDLITATAADTPARLAVGTNGYILSADSTESTGLKWIAPASGGGMTLINSGGTALTTATTTVTSIPGTYKYLIVYVTDYYMSTNDQLMRIYFNSDTTATNYGALALRSASGAGDLGWNNDARISQYGIKNAANQNFASITVPDYANATTYKQFVVNGSYQRGNDNIKANDLTIGSWHNTSAITSVSINTAGGTWSDGTMWVYGVN